MPQVPGSQEGQLFPTQPLDTRPAYAPQVSIRVDPNMFGANIAAAVEHLGGQMQKSSDEMFQRALAFQQLRNESAANEKTMDAALKIGNLENDLRSKEGNNLVRALPQYQADVMTALQDGGADLNPAAKRMYDQQTRRMAISSIVNAGGWAATAQKQALHADNKAKIELAQQQLFRMGSDPNGVDPEAMKGALNDIDAASRNSSNLLGLSQEAADAEAGKARSSGLLHVVSGLAKLDPVKAKEFLEEQKGNMDPSDVLKAQGAVDDHYTNTLARISATNVQKDYMPWFKGSSQSILETTQSGMQILTKRAAQILDPDGKGDKSFQVISGKRSTVQQAEIWERSKHGKAFAAAPPGYSNHEWGGAIDIAPGKNTSYDDVEKAFYQASKETGVALSSEHARLGARDRGHYSIALVQDASKWTPPPRMAETERVRLARNYTEAQMPDSDRIGDMAENRVLGHIRQDERLQEQAFKEQHDIVSRAMFDRGDGQPPQNRDEWANTPGVEDALQKIYSLEGGAQKVQQIEKDFANWMKFKSNVSDQATLDHIAGMKASDPEAYMKLNPMDPSLNLGRGDRQKLANEQRAFSKQNMERDPKVTRAMSLLAYKLSDPNLHIRKGGDAQEQKNYYTFVGVLQRELEAAGKTLSPKEIEDLGNRLLYQQVVHKPTRFFGLLGGDEKQPPLYQSGYSLTTEQRKAILEDLMKDDPFAAPTERDIDIEAARRAYEAVIPAKRVKEGFGAIGK